MLIFFFFLFPFFTIIFYTLNLWRGWNHKVNRLWYLAIMLAVYLGLLNSTKELSGDFLAYSEYFYDVPKYDIISYLMNFGKEPLFYAYTWIGYYLFLGSWKLFVVSFTAINYLLISYCLIKITVHLKVSWRNVIVALFFMAFFFQEFAAVGNLIRQALSESITMVFLTRLYLEKRRSLWLAICALCVHTSCLPVIGIGLIPSVQEKIALKTLVKMLIPLLVLVILFYVLGDYMINIPFLGYIFTRVNDSEKLLGADSWQEVVGLQSAMYALILMLAAMATYLYIKIYKQKQCFIEIGLVNFNIIFIVSMLIFNSIGAYYLLMRYFFYIYVFQSLLFLIFIHRSRLFILNLMRIPLMLLLIVYFFYNYTHNIFIYSTIMEAIFLPVPIFLV